MQLKFTHKKFIFSLLLLLGSAVPAFEATAHDFNVTVNTKDQTHPHPNEGSKIGFLVNGVQGRTLILVRGKTYTFKVDSNPMHDFYLTTDTVGWGTGTLTEGVEGNFTYNGVVTFKPTAATPDVVYYQCRNHKYMGGQIHIVNPGEEGKIKIAEPAAAPATAKAAQQTIDKGELKQKLDFADMTINKSEAAKRITASSNAEAKARLKDAQDRLAAGQQAFVADNLPLAKSKIDEATSLMADATRLVPSEYARTKAKARYDELVKGIKDLEASYEQNYQAIVKEGGAKNVEKIDSVKMHSMMGTAKALADEGQYEKANEILSLAQNEASSALNKMLANRTMSYEMKFSSPEQEYAHELSRYSSFEELIPSAIEQKQPTKETLALMESFVKKAKEKRDQAAADAKQRSFPAALENIKNGTEQLESALRLIGVR